MDFRANIHLELFKMLLLCILLRFISSSEIRLNVFFRKLIYSTWTRRSSLDLDSWGPLHDRVGQVDHLGVGPLRLASRTWREW